LAVALALPMIIVSQQATAQSDSATVTKDLGCGGFIPTASGGVGELIYTSESVVIVKGNGTTSLSCHFDIPPGLEPASTTRTSGFGCYTFLGLTFDTRMQASSGGNATLSCRVRTR
jgi:preprotein translocase subunit YajC